jgi:hypothetical protein
VNYIDNKIFIIAILNYFKNQKDNFKDELCDIHVVEAQGIKKLGLVLKKHS